MTWEVWTAHNMEESTFPNTTGGEGGGLIFSPFLSIHTHLCKKYQNHFNAHLQFANAFKNILTHQKNAFLRGVKVNFSKAAVSLFRNKAGIELQFFAQPCVCHLHQHQKPFHWCGLAGALHFDSHCHTISKKQLDFLAGQHNLCSPELPLHPNPSKTLFLLYSFYCGIFFCLWMSSPFFSVHPALPFPLHPLVIASHPHVFALGVTCFLIWFLHSRISMYI